MKKNKTTKKEKLIDKYKKSDLVKIAKMNDISLKMRNDKVKTKLQLFNSLKRKKLIQNHSLLITAAGIMGKLPISAKFTEKFLYSFYIYKIICPIF